MAKRRGPKAPRKEIKIRVRNVPPLLSALPLTGQILINGLLGTGKQRSFLTFAINTLPPTVNHMYIHTRNGTRLTEDAKVFRDLVHLAIGHQKFTYKCGGTAAVLIFLESPHWITKKLTVREMDVDNRVKPTLDGVKNAIDIPDETNWELHVWKVASKQTRTTVYLFDLGDVVDFCG